MGLSPPLVLISNIVDPTRGSDPRIFSRVEDPLLYFFMRDFQDATTRSILRKSGLLEIYQKTEGKTDFKIALIDGPIAREHSCFDTARIQQMPQTIFDTPNSSVVRHATFIASMLVGRGSKVLGLCPDCTLVSVPVVSEKMINGALSTRAVSERLAEAVMAAVTCDVDVIQLSLEFSKRAIHGFEAVAEALSAAARAGIRTIIPTGNSPTIQPSPILASPGVVPVAMADWNGLPHKETTFGRVVAERGIMTIGVDIPGARSPEGFTIRSGSSFAAAVVAGSFALLCAVLKGPTRDDIWSALTTNTENRLPSLLIPRVLDVEASFARLNHEGDML